MPQMSTAWPWSSQACATSGIRAGCSTIGPRWGSRAAMLLFSAFILSIALSCGAQAESIQAGSDIQAAIDSASAGDTIIVSAGDYSSFRVDRPVAILAQAQSYLSAGLQKPAIVIKSDGVTISGFSIRGVGKDTTAKFNYYMQNPAAAAGASLDDANCALVVEGDGFSLENTTIYGAQVGISAEGISGITMQNVTLNGCDTGASILQSRAVTVTGCRISNCKKYGLDVERSSDVRADNNSVINNSNGGILLKESSGGVVQDNKISYNTFGLSLWNSSANEVRRNHADHNYYGILVTDWSCYNNITNNVAQDNSNSEIVAGFGIGISLQENSSFNMLLGNSASGNFNGLEVSRGCHHNAVYANNASDNKHGIRLNENRNNLIFGNNFKHNDINAYENTSLNIWNTTIGNYYTDYQGSDGNGDGIGDDPYPLPGPESVSMDMMPLVRPFGEFDLDIAALRAEVTKYAVFAPLVADLPTTSMQDGVAVISRKTPTRAPKWDDSDSFDASAPPFQKENSFLNGD